MRLSGFALCVERSEPIFSQLGFFSSCCALRGDLLTEAYQVFGERKEGVITGRERNWLLDHLRSRECVLKHAARGDTAGSAFNTRFVFGNLSGVALQVMVSSNDRDELAQSRHHLDADNFDTLDQFPATGQG